MAPPRIIANCGQLTLNWSGTTRTWRNVFGLIGNPTLPVFDQTLANTLFTGISTAFTGSGLATLFSDLAILESITIRDLHVANAAPIVSTGTPIGGGSTADMLPLNAAAVVTLRTAFAGKSFRGRSYIAGFDETANDVNGRISAAANTAAQAFVQNIVVTLTAHSLAMAVLSFPRDAKTIPAKTHPAFPGMGNTVTGLQTRTTKWNSQRRRTGRE